MNRIPITKIPQRPAGDYFLPDSATIQERIKMSALPRSHFRQLNLTASAGNARLQADEIMVSQLLDPVKQHETDFKCDRLLTQLHLKKSGRQITFIVVMDPCLPCSTKTKKGGVGNGI